MVKRRRLNIKLLDELNGVKIYRITRKSLNRCKILQIPYWNELKMQIFDSQLSKKETYPYEGSDLIYGINALGEFMVKANWRSFLIFETYHEFIKKIWELEIKMVKIPVGYKLIRDIADIQMAGKPNLIKDIGILKANRTDEIVFNKFKKDYPEFFDKTHLRNFSKKTPNSILRSVRRAYREGIDSTVSIRQINGIALREAYAPLRTNPIRKEKIRKLTIKLEEEEEERRKYEEEEALKVVKKL